jgi:hypothetical protein
MAAATGNSADPLPVGKKIMILVWIVVKALLLLLLVKGETAEFIYKGF